MNLEDLQKLPVDLLAETYEKSLLSEATSRARRRRDGIYYTPREVVEYIVTTTLEEVLEGLTPVEVADLRILDPSCGAGSFLIQVFRYLLDWHLCWYLSDDISRWTSSTPPRLQPMPDQKWRLSLEERRRILLQNIYGLDIDPEAIEVARLTLALELVRHETDLPHDTDLVQADLLCELESKITTGDFLTATVPKMDVVLGNPPYFNVDDTWEKEDPRKHHLALEFQRIHRDKADISYYFLAKSLDVVREKGRVAMILSRAFLQAFKADKLRASLLETAQFEEIVDFQNYRVFDDAAISTAIVRLMKNPDAGAKSFPVHHLIDAAGEHSLTTVLGQFRTHFQTLEVHQDDLGPQPWVFADDEVRRILATIDAKTEPLGEAFTLGQGMQTGRNRVFSGLSTEVISDWKLTEDLYFLRARNSFIQPYFINPTRREVVLYLEDVETFDALPGPLCDYLLKHRDQLESRAAFRRGDCDWWRFTWPLHKELSQATKIFSPYLATTNRFAADEERKYLGLTDTTVIFVEDQPEAVEYALGVLNSTLLTFRHRFLGKLKGRGIREYFWNSISRFPFKRVDFNDPRQVIIHDQICQAVRLVRDCDDDARRAAHRKRIDELVFDLYEIPEAMRGEIVASLT